MPDAASEADADPELCHRRMESIHGIDYKRRQNDAALISRLPVEILAEIVKIVASQSPPGHSHTPQSIKKRRRRDHCDSTLTQRLGWIRLTHVCSAWRRHILCLQSLWAAYIGTIPSAIDEMLSRAGSHCPIKISVGSESFAPDKYGPHIKARVTEIITGHRITRQPFASLVDLISECPSLEHLEISCAHFYDGFQDGRLLNAPKLRTLRLSNRILRCHTSTLVSLDVFYEANFTILHPPTTALLELIRSSRGALQNIQLRLRDWAIEPIAPTGAVRWSQVDPPIVLPHLRTLVVGDEPWIMRYLAIPDIASVTIYCRSGRMDHVWRERTEETICAALRVASRTRALSIVAQSPQEDPSFLVHELWFNFHDEPFGAVRDAYSQPHVAVCLADTSRTFSYPLPSRLANRIDILRNALSKFKVSPDIICLENSHLFQNPSIASDIILSFPTLQHLMLINPHAPRSDVLQALAAAEGTLQEMTRLSLSGEGKAETRRVSHKRLHRQLATLVQKSTKLERVSVHSSLHAYVEGSGSASDELRKVVRYFDWDAD